MWKPLSMTFAQTGHVTKSNNMNINTLHKVESCCTLRCYSCSGLGRNYIELFLYSLINILSTYYKAVTLLDIRDTTEKKT